MIAFFYIYILLLYLFLQKNGVKTIKTVNNSNLPNNIKKEHHHFAKPGKCPKFASGFKVPKAGPTFPKLETAPPIAVSKSKPNIPKPNAPIINNNM